MSNLRPFRQISLVAAAVLIGGCGGSLGSGTTHGRTSPAPVARPSGESVSHLAAANRAASGEQGGQGGSAHAQFVAFARAVNLRTQDVPGFRPAPDTGGHIRVHNKAFEDSSAYGRCFRFAKEARALIKRSSDTLQTTTKFSRSTGPQFAKIKSTVEVARSRATARRELREGEKALANAAARRCLSRAFDALGGQNQLIHVRAGTMRITVGNFRMTPLSVAAATHGTDGGFGFSMTLAVTYRLTARGRTFIFPTSLGLDVLGFVVGRSTVTLVTTALGSSFPPALEASSFATLISRASTAAGSYPDVLH